MRGSEAVRFMDRMAAVMRKHGLQSVTRATRNLLDKVYRRGISVTAEGVTLTGALKDRASLYSIEEGRFEPSTVQRFKEVVKLGMTVIDIGSYLGYYSIIASRLVGPSGRIYSFEPNPESFFYMYRNVVANHCGNVVAYRKAVSFQGGNRNLYINREDVTRTSLFPRTGTGRSILVESTTVDEVVGSKEVDVVKIDVEGAELHVLTGMERTIRGNPGLILFVELNPASLQEAGASADALYGKLHDLNYTSIVRLDEQFDERGNLLLCNLVCGQKI